MKLSYITLMVRDLEKSEAFYRNLVGLQVMRRLDMERGSIRFLGNAQGETMLELIAFAGVEKVETKGLVMSWLVEGDLEEVRNTALALGYGPSELVDQGPKPRYFTVLDPDGIVVEFSAAP